MQAFGGDTFLDIPTRSVNKKTKVKTLQHLAKDVLLDDTYKVEQLQVALANVVHTEKREQWLHNCPIHLSAYIPHVWEDHLEFEMFSYLEFSLKRQQVEHRTLDYMCRGIVMPRSLIFMSTHKATAARCLRYHQATYGQPPSTWPL